MITAIQYRHSEGGGAGGRCDAESTIILYSKTGELLNAKCGEVLKAVNAHDYLVNTLSGILKYASVCKGTDIERVKYLAQQALDNPIVGLKGGQ